VQGNEQGYDEIKNWKYEDWGQLILIDVCFIDVMIVLCQGQISSSQNSHYEHQRFLNIHKKYIKTALSQFHCYVVSM
jgi:hypothetical protein